MQTNVLEYLESTALKYPDKIAFADAKESISFSELQMKAMQLGSGLLEYTKGITGRCIAVSVDRTVRSLVAFFGVLYSGNCYVPIDVQMPVQRMQAIMDTAQPIVIINKTGKKTLPTELQNHYSVTSYENLVDASVKKEYLMQVRENHTDLNPIYVIFTSGSTGIPKGVCISHRSVIDFTDWLANTMKISCQDVLGNQAPFYFDMAGKDIFLTIKCGCTTHILPHSLFSFTKLLMKKLNEKKITTLFWAVAAIRMVAVTEVLQQNPPKYITKVGFGGENLSVKWLNKWKQALPNACFMNMYGPTEATIDCLYSFVNKEYNINDNLPLGQPCSNTKIILIDKLKKEITDPNIVGEICVKGSCLALGYYNDSKRTDESFCQNPLNHAYKDIIYYTGDLAKYGEDGQLYFIGRKDNQIKHSGYRIELGEIENRVNALENIEISVCIFDEEKDQIVLFYQGDALENQLLEVLTKKLPKYMLPNVIIKADNIPYNANNKIDRVKLKIDYLN